MKIFYACVSCKQMASNVTEPSRELNSVESKGTTYDKAKTYWQNVEPSVCGMLGGLPEVGFIGKSRNLCFKSRFHDINIRF